MKRCLIALDSEFSGAENTRMIERPTAEDFLHAAEALLGVAVHTPLVPLPGDAASEIYLKLETLQPIGSFKIRGIFHAVSQLSARERALGLSTVSAGNTAQALAWCGRHFGVPARSVMPETAPATKIEAVRRLGGEPVLVPVAEVFRFLTEHLWENEPYAFIHPWTDPQVWAGHGTLGLEIVEDLPEVSTVYVPVGGGGLIVGVASAVKALHPETRIVAVEPEGCPALRESLRLGRPTQVECSTICDGVAVPYITEELYPRLEALVDDVQLVPDEAVEAMIARLLLEAKILAEPSGALAVAAAVADRSAENAPRVAIVTGGSIDRERLIAILSAAR